MEGSISLHVILFILNSTIFGKIGNIWYSAINGDSHDSDAYSLSFSGSILTVTTEDAKFRSNDIVYAVAIFLPEEVNYWKY